MRDSRQSEGAVLLELAERCEQVTGPDRELHYQIAKALGLVHETDRGPLFLHNDPPGSWSPLRYTASLDAAMTLVPADTLWEVGHKVNYPIGKGEPNKANYAWVNVGPPGAVKQFNGKSCATPALALCAAALRAQSVSPLSNEEKA